MIDMKNYKESNLNLDIQKKTFSTLERKDSSLNMKHGANIFREKEDNCTILYIKFVNIIISKLVIVRIFM